MIPLFLLNLVGGRKVAARIIMVVVALVIVGAIVGLGWWVRSLKADSDELARIRPLYDALVAGQAAANEAVKKQEPVDAAERAALARERERQERERQAISREWARIRAVEETTDEAGNPVVRLSAAWGVCFAAAAAGDAADVAACEAAGGDGAVTTGAGSGGVQVPP